MTAGRPTDYCQETADKVLGLLAGGGSLRKICKADDLPHRDTVFEWLSRYPEFSDRYAHARALQADCMADDVVNVAEEVRDGTLQPHQGRVVMDASKWFAAVVAPHKYAERRQLQHTGPDGGPLEVHHIGQAERQARIAELEAKRLTIDETGRTVCLADKGSESFKP